MSRIAAARTFPSVPTPSVLPTTPRETIELGRQVIAQEARAVEGLLDRLDDEFASAVEKLVALRGNLMVTGIGKAGLIGQKLAATFASTGTRAHFLHPAEAFHGDLGRIGEEDCVLALSQSGETSEILQLLAPLASRGISVIALTSTRTSTLARAADMTLTLGRLDEACSLGLAPSSSTAAMLALGDALALVTSRLKGFEANDFARFHPGGSLGRKLARVDQQMRPLDQCRVARDDATVRDVLAASMRPGRRSGAVLLTDDAGQLTGIFTDSDLARLIERRDDTALDRPIHEQMTRKPATIATGMQMEQAIDLLADRKLSELPVIDQQGRPLGLIDVTDIIGLVPEPTPTPTPFPTPPSSRSDAIPTIVRLYPGDEAPETD